ncbi:MAG: efflux RND transporter periplasmic adaptor subunit [Pirellula sp.]
MNQPFELAYSVDEADRLLDRLEKIAKSDTSNELFWQQALEGLRTLTESSAAAMVLLVQERWVIVQSSGSRDLVGSMEVALTEKNQEFLTELDFFELSPDECFGAVPIAGVAKQYGYILLGFRPAIPRETWTQVRTIAEAFAEICWLRVSKRWEKCFGNQMQSIRGSVERMVRSASLPELRRELVDSLVSILRADRGSLVSVGKRPNLVACSGVDVIDAGSTTVKAIENVALIAISENDPLLGTPSESSDHRDSKAQVESVSECISENRVVLPWSEARKARDVIVLEWQHRGEMLEQMQNMSSLLTILQPVWHRQHQWLSLSPRIRRLSDRRSIPEFFQYSSFLTTSLGACLVLALVGWLLSRPYPMAITSDAYLEPVSIRSVYANADGFIDQILVEDGARVVKGQALAKLRSPGLDLQIEESLGKLRAMAEKRNGLGVSINQLSNRRADSESSQTKITSEMLILDAQEKHAQETLAFLRQEQEQLVMESPIEGVVVATELKRELEKRPVRRGDSIFRVAALEGEWRLAIQVADRDTHYVGEYYPKRESKVDFVFDSLPSERFDAEITCITPSAENVFGKGSFQQVFAAVSRETAERTHMGATARVTFHCGHQPAWFVWSRPLVEFIQKRTRLFSKTPSVGKGP